MRKNHSSNLIQVVIPCIFYYVYCGSKITNSEGIKYASVVWSKRSNLATTRNNLSKVRRLGCICITSDMRICLIATIEAILDHAPLHLQLVIIESIARKYTFRMIKEE